MNVELKLVVDILGHIALVLFLASVLINFYPELVGDIERLFK